jgi:mannose-1-phosphate guanylyltransferase/mannose-6-phosphate isomerase
MATTTIPTIKSGGAGTRLWPMSTPEQSKQFHQLAGTHAMIQATALRFRGTMDGVTFLDPIIVAGSAHRRHGAQRHDCGGDGA